MALRKLRWLSAAVLATVAVLANPARSSADTQFIVQEFDGGGATVGSALIFSSSANNLPSSSNPAATQNFSISSLAATPINTTSGFGSLSTTVISSPNSGFDASHYFTVTVSSDQFFNQQNAGGSGMLVNDPGKSATDVNAINSNTSTTSLFTGFIGSTAPFSPQSTRTDTEVTGGGDARSQSMTDPVPGQYGIQQVLTIRLNPNGATDVSFTDTLSSSLTVSPPAAVPAPAGLVLALAAVPVLGLRRALRRKATV